MEFRNSSSIIFHQNRCSYKVLSERTFPQIFVRTDVLTMGKNWRSTNKTSVTQLPLCGIIVQIRKIQCSIHKPGRQMNLTILRSKCVLRCVKSQDNAIDLPLVKTKLQVQTGTWQPHIEPCPLYLSGNH